MARFSRALTQALTQPSYQQGLFSAGQMIGQAPSAYGALQENKRKQEASQGLLSTTSSMDFTDPGRAIQQIQADAAAAEIDPKPALEQYTMAYKMNTLQEEKAAQQAALLRQQKARESLAKRAQSLGLDEMAQTITTGGMDMEDAAKAVREQEIEKLVYNRGESSRRQFAQSIGFSPQEAISIAKAPKDEYERWINGEEGDLKAFAQNGEEPQIFRVNKQGKVRDPQSGYFKNPSELGLTPAPDVQKIINADSVAKEQLAEAGVDNFVALHEKANNAQMQIENIDRSLGYLNNMPTGIGAPIRTFIQRVGVEFGMDVPSDLVNYQSFLAEAGKRVAEQIKAFGSGTGLSDADREYAKLISAADATQAAESLKRLLKIQRDSSTETIRLFSSAKEKYRTGLGADGYLVDSFDIRQAPPAPPVSLTPSARSYLDQARQLK